MVNRRQFLIQNLRSFSNVAELRHSAFFAEYGPEIETLLSTPEVWACPGAAPRLQSFVRVVQWNIEKGRQLPAILDGLRSDPVLRWADIVLLNEADYGMNRSGNRHVAHSLATALDMHMAFGTAHLELTRGTGEDLEPPGENCESLQGNAVLSRHPIFESRIVPLPVCFEPYEFHEKRYGRRVCVWARLQIAGRSLWAGSTHLEVRNTPRCRAAQMRYLLEHLPGGGDEPFLLGGDLNSNGFARGTRLRTAMSVLRLVAGRPAAMRHRMRHPEEGAEPLFRIARSAGFSWEGLNSAEDTAAAPIGNLEDAGLLPGFIVRPVRERLAPYGSHLRFKLDWLLGRGVRGLAENEVRDPQAGEWSRNPGRGELERTGPSRISDHLPIYADFRICE